MERTLQILNDLDEQGILTRYAIGGAMAAAYYLEPFATFDLDVFVTFPAMTNLLITLSPLYDVLDKRGYKSEGDCVIIEGVPVQFLPAYNALIEEALDQAKEITYGKTRTRVVSSEHLIAICLQTGRHKDRLRVDMFRDQAELNLELLSEIVQRHNLEKVWKQWTN